VVLCDGRKRKVGTRGESLAWLTSKIHLSHIAVEVNTVNIDEKFRFGKLGVKGS
jgi:predicted secreted hydrolase